MTDSEDDMLSNNVYSFPNDATTIHAKGPNFSTFSTFSCRNNFGASTIHTNPRNFERRNLNYDQRSLYYEKRDTSPMSLLSVPDLRPRNFQHSYNMGGGGYKGSVINVRSCSPTSVRSIDTNVSMSATDIAIAIKNEAYNKNDLRLIKEALNKHLKRKLRKRVEKRRNQRLLPHISKYKSGDDSGEQGSDSSFSSDDCRSIRTAPSVVNNSRYKKLNLTNMKIFESNIYNNCTANMKRKSLRNMISSDTPAPQNQIKATKINKINNEKGVLLRERFKNGFLLPSQRFNKPPYEPVSSNLSRLKSNNAQYGLIINSKTQVNNSEILNNNSSQDMESEQEELFSEITTIERNCEIVNVSRKRTIEVDKKHCNLQKKSKVAKTQFRKSPNKVNCINNDADSDFIFAKPQMPVRNTTNKKKLHSPEKLISKSRDLLFDPVEQLNNILSPIKELPIQATSKITDIEFLGKENVDSNCGKPAHLSDDLSLQPSFIRRKLFTQRLDVAEKKNLSDSSLSNSPQVKNISSSKEKCKARKLASSQSCLSRDVVEEDNNFLDLIHKIVPAEQINVTNTTNKIAYNRNSQRESNDKWDITSVISTCFEKDISDTYTDEEIFKLDNHCNSKSEVGPKKTNAKIQSQLTSNCKIVLEKLPSVRQSKVTSNTVHKQAIVKGTPELDKEKSKDRLNTFWDTDIDSELENYESSCNLHDLQINKDDKSINKNKDYRNQKNHKAECTSEELATALRKRNKCQNGTTIKHATGAGTKQTSVSNKRKLSPGTKENNNNLLNMNLCSNIDTQKTSKPNELSKTVTLIGHRMGRPKSQVKTKKINTIDSPKDSDVSIKVKEKPNESSKQTTLSIRLGRSKSQVKKSKLTNSVVFSSQKDTDTSTSDLNISFRSLRSYHKNNKVNEKVVERNLRPRNRSTVKGL